MKVLLLGCSAVGVVVLACFFFVVSRCAPMSPPILETTGPARSEGELGRELAAHARRAMAAIDRELPSDATAIEVGTYDFVAAWTCVAFDSSAASRTTLFETPTSDAEGVVSDPTAHLARYCGERFGWRIPSEWRRIVAMPALPMEGKAWPRRMTAVLAEDATGRVYVVVVWT
jgi:hypothetical protein